VVTVNYEFFDNQTVGGARNIVSQLQSGERPPPTRGGPLRTFKQIERQIAGLFDDEALAPEANGSGVPTEIGVQVAIERGDTAPSYAIDRSASVTDAKPAEKVPAAPVENRAQPATGAAPGIDTTKVAAHKRAPRRSTKPKSNLGEQGTLDSAAEAEQPTSQHDAPLETAQSDPANEAEPGAEKGD
jgi:NADH-quinone oxidoreductase subunit E